MSVIFRIRLRSHGVKAPLNEQDSTSLLIAISHSACSGLLKLDAKDLLALDRELELREKQSPHNDSGLIYNIDKADPDYETEYGQVCGQFGGPGLFLLPLLLERTCKLRLKDCLPFLLDSTKSVCTGSLHVQNRGQVCMDWYVGSCAFSAVIRVRCPCSVTWAFELRRFSGRVAEKA